jgi:NAD(P)-dependent dehydrogenase (short-subunit alcohol dehydrogenase family)
MPKYDVKGKVALVTGSAGGIGWATAKALHDRGASVVVCDLDHEASVTAAGLIGDERVVGLATDVTDRAALNQAVATATERFGGLDIVVANAGIAPRGATVRSIGDEEYSQVVDVNLNGVWNTVRAALPQIIERRGHVVVIASVYAYLNGMGQASYAMTKAGVEALGRTLRTEMPLYGAGATTCYFGFIDTNMVAEGLKDPLADRLMEEVPRPLRKMLPPSAAGEAIAKAVEGRKPTVVIPRIWRFMKWTRGISDPFYERGVLGNKTIMEVMAEADAREVAPGG